MENKVRIAREMQDAYGEDHAVLTSHMHDMRAAKEDAERELAHTRKMCEEAKKDWHRKLKDRRKEVGIHAFSVFERRTGASSTCVICLIRMLGRYGRRPSTWEGGQGNGEVQGGREGPASQAARSGARRLDAADRAYVMSWVGCCWSLAGFSRDA